MKKRTLKKLEHHKKYTLTHEGHVWKIDFAIWSDGERSVMRVYRIEGDINKREILYEALQLEAAARGLHYHLVTEETHN